MTFAGVGCPTCAAKVRVQTADNVITLSCPTDGLLAQLNYDTSPATPFENIRRQVVNAIQALRLSKAASR